MTSSHTYDALVIGGGLNGLSTLYHLHKAKPMRLALLEQFSLGHSRGSSHGDTRVTRSAYHDPSYVTLMNLCNAEAWPSLEKEANQTLRQPSPCVFFGPEDGPFAKYAEAVIAGGAHVERIDRSTAQKRYPAFRFQEGYGILDDHTAGVIAASDTLKALCRLCQHDNIDIFEQTQVLSIEPQSDRVAVVTSRGTFWTERLVLTAGAWIPQLLPSLQSHLHITRQTVLYVKLEGNPNRFAIGQFPIWAHIEGDTNPLHYSLPGFRGRGMKIARHVTDKAADDPNLEQTEGEPHRVQALLAFLEKHMIPKIKQVETTETCLYTNTATEDFLLDLHPQHPNIAIGTGFSGHGFKFGPLTGRILAEMVLQGKTTLPEFEEHRQRFSLRQKL